ncbi:hypothetical protein A2Y99_01240 [Candidatus Gottesmanbacteria bacterium RBG_13_37_7]|uniref:Glycosyltransferase 2-like domain-containing protein n=1 Tax=Candidatus Gottesmanbacteria bacterium RBG_13_37_7 TaxID=1798369 RepID=A0A1F5YH28_9BACT|nr:MAG: hypothetical protein A2Y99_01240 [Candidatus Gottesmanbacteria bacterium RBG_13_37_7]
MQTKKPFLSVIICTYDRINILAQCLRRIYSQRISDKLFEVVVVDNNSHEETRNLILKFQKKYPNIIYSRENKQGLSHARNNGYLQSKGKYLIYIDDDVFVPRNYLRSIFASINKFKPDILGGPVYPFYKTSKPKWFKNEFEIRKYEKKSGFSRKCRISGGNFIIKRNLLEKLGKFDTNLGMKGSIIRLGEEAKVLDSYRRITPEKKQRVYYSLDCYVKHLVSPEKMKIGYLLKRSFDGGRMSVKMKMLNKDFSFVGFIILVVYNLKIIFQRFFHDLRDLCFHGIKGVDWVVTIRRISFSLGFVTEGLLKINYFIK